MVQLLPEVQGFLIWRHVLRAESVSSNMGALYYSDAQQKGIFMWCVVQVLIHATKALLFAVIVLSAQFSTEINKKKKLKMTAR